MTEGQAARLGNVTIARKHAAAIDQWLAEKRRVATIPAVALLRIAMADSNVSTVSIPVGLYTELYSHVNARP